MDAWAVIIIGMGVMQVLQLILILYLWSNKPPSEESLRAIEAASRNVEKRVDRLWVKVVGANGKPGQDRMATQHDLNNLKQIQGFFDVRLEEIEKVLKLSVPGHMRPVPRDD